MINKLKNELIRSRDFLSFSILKIFGQGITFIVPLLIAKILSPGGFGSYSLSIMIVFFFMSVFIGSSQIPFVVIANEESKATQKINRSFSVQLLFFLASTIFVSFLIFAFDDLILSFTELTSRQLFFLFLAYIGMSFNSFIDNLFLALDKKINHCLHFLLVGSINLILVLYCCLENNLNISTIFLIYFISSIISMTIFLFIIEFDKLFPFVFDKKTFDEMFRWTKWQIIGSAAFYLINWGDNLVLRYFVSMEEIGTYNLGYQIFKGVMMLLSMISVYFMPFLAQNMYDETKLKKYIYDKRMKLLFIGVICIFISIIVGPFILNLIYGEVYSTSGNVLRLLLIGSIFHLYSVLYYPLFNALKRYKYIQIAYVVQVLLNLALDIIFVSRFGLLGAAFATTISYFVISMVHELYFRNQCKDLGNKIS